jgi:hypothetical protein
VGHWLSSFVDIYSMYDDIVKFGKGMYRLESDT